MCIIDSGQGSSWIPMVESNPGLFGLISAVISVLATLWIGVWAVKTVTQARTAARFGFYVNFVGYLELLATELEKGEPLLSAYIIDDDERQRVFNQRLQPNDSEVLYFSDLCRKFLDFLLSSENNVPPKSLKKALSEWTQNQLELIKFLHKWMGIGTISFTANYTLDIEKIKGVVLKLKKSIEPDIGLSSEFNPK